MYTLINIIYIIYASVYTMCILYVHMSAMCSRIYPLILYLRNLKMRLLSRQTLLLSSLHIKKILKIN